MLKKGNILEQAALLFVIRGGNMGTMKRKNINTRKEQEKKAQREKEAKKKQMLQQLPPKQGKKS